MRRGLVFAALGAALGAFGIVTQAMGLPELTEVLPGRPSTQPITGAALLIAGLSVAMRCRPRVTASLRHASRIGGALVVVIAASTVLEYALGVELWVDRALPLAVGSGEFPGRPSIITAFALLSLGGAIVVFDVTAPKASPPREWLVLTSLFLAFVSLVGDLYGAGAVYEIAGSEVRGVALPTAIAIVLIGGAVLAARSSEGIARLLVSSGPGGVLERRLGTAALVAVPMLGLSLLALAALLDVRDLALVLAFGTVASASLGFLLVTITALRLDRTHEAERAASRRLTEVVEHAPVGIFITDLDGRYSEVNAAGCRMLGRGRDEILGKAILDFIPEDQEERLWENRESLLRGETVHLPDGRVRRADGSLLPVDVMMNLLPDRRWQAFIGDITDRVALERELVESRDFLRGVLESSTAYGIVAEDLGGHIVLWNEGARRTYGYASDEILGSSSGPLVPESDRVDWERLHAYALTHGTAEATLEARRMDGSVFAAQVVCTRRLNATGAPAGFLLVSRDLSAEQRRLAEQEFLARAGVELAACLEPGEALERMARLAVDFIGEGCAIDVLHEGETRRAAVAHRDPARAEILRRTMDEVPPIDRRGHPVASVLETRSARIVEETGEALREALAAGPDHRAVLDAIGLESTMIVPLVARGQLLAVMSIGLSATSRKFGPDDLRVAEELALRAALALDNVELYQRSRIQAAEREVLLKEIHHRVKNNLQVISSLFALQAGRTESHALKSLIYESRLRVQSIALVHEQLYGSSDLAAIDFDTYLRGLSETIRASYGAERVSIEVGASGVVLDVEEAVPCALLVCEIVSNSLKHAFPEGAGRIWVNARLDDEGRCVLEIADDGVGIPMDLDWTKTRSLGLRLVRSLTHQLRGTVELDASRGTRFTIRFPLRHAAATPGRHQAPGPGEEAQRAAAMQVVDERR